MNKQKTIGPVTGNPPSLEWISVDQLEVDAEYQRTTLGSASAKIISGMVKKWDWQLCQPLVVSKRNDQTKFVIDGQHRLAGAKARGDIAHLPCVISTGLTGKSEASAFVELNTSRQKLQQTDIFRAMLAAGDEDAILVNKMISDCGMTLAPHSVTDRWEPGMMNCAPMLVRYLKRYDQKIVECALVALAEAYTGKVVSCAASILKALFEIYKTDATDEGFEPDRLIEALSLMEPHDLLANGRAIRIRNPVLTPTDAIEQAIMIEYRAL